MTVENISKAELDKIVDTMYDTDTQVMGYTISEDDIKQVPSHTWGFISRELNALSDMTYTCLSKMRGGVAVKEFILTCSSRQQLIIVLNFLEAVLVDKKQTIIRDIDTSDNTKYAPEMEGEGANCPLFTSK